MVRRNILGMNGKQSQKLCMIKSKLLSRYKNIYHGFSTKNDGSFRLIRNPNLKKLNIPLIGLIKTQQIHSDKIAIVDKNEINSPIQAVDGLITNKHNQTLGITTADCIPFLFYDPIHNIIANAHAGWKGSALNIGSKLVTTMMNMGSQVNQILVVIGPHIGSCCYDIDVNRQVLFEKLNYNAIIKRNGKAFLDLGKVNIKYLVDTGILPENIEVIPYCTSCRSDLFYSYRREGENSGRMINVICLAN